MRDKEKIIFRVGRDAIKLRTIPELNRTLLIIGDPSMDEAHSIRLSPSRARKLIQALMEYRGTVLAKGEEK